MACSQLCDGCGRGELGCKATHLTELHGVDDRMAEHTKEFDKQVVALNKEIKQWYASDKASQKLADNDAAGE